MPSLNPSAMSILCANSWITTSRPDAGWRLSWRVASHAIETGPAWGDASPMIEVCVSSNTPTAGPARRPVERVVLGCTMTDRTPR